MAATMHGQPRLPPTPARNTNMDFHLLSGRVGDSVQGTGHIEMDEDDGFTAQYHEWPGAVTILKNTEGYDTTLFDVISESDGENSVDFG